MAPGFALGEEAVQSGDRAPERTLSALEVHQALGHSKNAVLGWPARGCPHSMSVRRNKPSPSFNLAEVKAWLASKGMDVSKNSNAAKQQSSKSGDADGGDGSGVGDSEWGDEDPTVFDAAEEEAVERIGDMDSRIRQLSLKIDRLSRKEVKDPAAAQRMAAALKPLMTELRALELHQIEMEKNRGELIGRMAATEMLQGVVSALTTGLEALTIDLPHAVWQAVAGSDVTDQDLFVRLVGVAVEKECAKVRTALAEGIDRQAADHAAGAGAAAGPLGAVGAAA